MLHHLVVVFPPGLVMLIANGISVTPYAPVKLLAARVPVHTVPVQVMAIGIPSTRRLTPESYTGSSVVRDMVIVSPERMSHPE